MRPIQRLKFIQTQKAVKGEGQYNIIAVQRQQVQFYYTA